MLKRPQTTRLSPLLRLRALPAVVLLALLLGGCSTSYHGSFSASSFIGDSDGEANAGQPVSAEHCQTKVLYLFPLGVAPSTARAIENAKGVRPGTRFLSDIAIDDRIAWRIGYARQCIQVDALAHE